MGDDTGHRPQPSPRSPETAEMLRRAKPVLTLRSRPVSGRGVWEPSPEHSLKHAECRDDSHGLAPDGVPRTHLPSRLCPLQSTERHQPVTPELKD